MRKLSLYAVILGICFSSAEVEEKKEQSVKIGGSLRYRHELILKEDQDSQNRHRVAAKAGLKAKINPHFKAGFELASGGETGTSSNQTLDGAFTKKELRINQAYLVYKPQVVKGLKLKAGKFKAPFEKVSKAELVWDSDIVPEGILLKYDNEYPSNIRAFLNAGGFWVQEHSGSTDDFILYAGQGGAKIPAGEVVSIKIAAGIYYYLNGKNQAVSAKDGAGGNTTDTTGGIETYNLDYTPVECMVEIGIKAGKIPVAAFGHFVQNIEVDDNNMGFLAGASLGKVKKPGSFALRAYYRELQKDAIFGTFGDSDFGGGSTDNKGVELNAKIGIAKNVSGAVTYFINQDGIDDGTSYQRGQFDVKVKF